MIKAFNITQQGERHIQKEVVCQDYSGLERVHLEKVDEDIIVAAVADGVGSCKFSQFGSKKAVESCLKCIKFNMNNLNELSDDKILNIIQHGFHFSLSEISKLAEKEEIPFLEYDTSLCVAVYVKNTVYYGQAGDSGIVVLYNDGQYEMITKRHKGEEANSLYPLRDKIEWEFGKSSKEVASLVLMTDGVLDFCVDSDAMNNRVFFPFLEDALTEKDKEENKQKEEWSEYLAGKSEDFPDIRKDITDDISFVVVQNTEMLKKIPPVIFDEETWKEDSAKRKKEIDEFLYADFYKYKEKSNQQSNKKEESEDKSKIEENLEKEVDCEEIIQDFVQLTKKVSSLIKNKLSK